MRLSGMAIASLLLVLPARAQQVQDWHVCQEKEKTTLGNHVRSCTAIIRSDRSSSKDKAIAYNNRGNILRDRGELDRAIADFDAAVRLEPKSADTYINRGIARYRRGDLDRAIADYDEAIRIDPSDIAIFHDRGVMWQRNGELDKALIDLDRAVRMSFADPEVYSDRGAVWFEKGRYDRALADFNQALKIAPGLASASIRRAAALDRKDRVRAELEPESRLDHGGLPADRPDRKPDSAGAR